MPAHGNGNLSGMRNLHEARIDRVTDLLVEFEPEFKMIVQVDYTILSNDEAVMYSESFSRDVSKVAGMEAMNAQERYDALLPFAVADAEAKYGRL